MTHHDPDFPTAPDDPFGDDPSSGDSPSDDPLDADLRARIAQAAARPTLRPSRDLWPGISARLDALPSDRPRAEPRAPVGAEPARARVLTFRAPRVDRSGAPRRRVLAAAAVALVALSSGATYLAMRRPDVPPVVATARTATTPARLAAAQPTPPLGTTPAGAAESSDPVERAPSPRELRVRPVARSLVRSVDVTVPGAVAYDREIADLRAIVAERHGELDSATVDVLARNLRIIDAAIAASRAALARDPHSPFLGEQLTRALGQKVDLLRTAALLPRT